MSLGGNDFKAVCFPPPIPLLMIGCVRVRWRANLLEKGVYDGLGCESGGDGRVVGGVGGVYGVGGGEG
jgi:hypothetical protein